jgi:hypothetical protein
LPRFSQQLLALDPWRNASRFLAQAFFKRIKPFFWKGSALRGHGAAPMIVHP